MAFGIQAVATERLSRFPDGRVLYRLRHRWRDGTSYVIFDPMDLVGKLAALVPPPRFNLVRYHGVLAPSARWRSRIVPVESQDGHASRSCPGCSGNQERICGQGKREGNPAKGHPRNYSWAELMKGVFGLDVLRCDSCGGRMRILSTRRRRSRRSWPAPAFPRGPRSLRPRLQAEGCMHGSRAANPLWP
jgi:hypothetical protein